MKVVILVLLSVATSFAAEESCAGRCHSFNPSQKCQCDTLCRYYRSCCADYNIVCQTKFTRGDVFDLPEENLTSTVIPTTTANPVPETEICSGKSFDAFLQTKNESIYAFRGEYFFELDEKSVMPGYPKLIKDVWGISGPIDAAFTRINCQGKTYIFKGNKYWRFDGNVLDEDYPRNISDGFNNIISDNVDAAFAVPAAGYHKKEKVYFFKGDRYYQYEFKHQPSHEECDRMTKASPSVLFTRYTDLYCDYNWDDLFTSLFQDRHQKDPRYITRDWLGIKPPIDAAMVGQLSLSSSSASHAQTFSLSPFVGSGRRGKTRGSRRRKGRGRGSRLSQSYFWEDLDLDYEERYFEAEQRSKGQKRGRGSQPSLFDYSQGEADSPDLDVVQEKAKPVQKVYFFQKDQYYRVDLKTKRIDHVNPPYPRSISKYWLGCKKEELAEKR